MFVQSEQTDHPLRAPIVDLMDVDSGFIEEL